MTGKGLRRWTAVVSVALATGLIKVLRRRTKEVTKDERTALLYQKAAVATISMCVPIMAVIGFILFAFRESLSPEMVAVGYVLVYAACGLLLVHSALYYYYARKH